MEFSPYQNMLVSGAKPKTLTGSRRYSAVLTCTTVSSPGPDKKEGTKDDIVVPQKKVEG